MTPPSNNTDPDGWLPYGVLTCAVFAVSTGAILTRLADAPALVIAAYRMGLALLIILPAGLWKSGRELRGLSRRDIRLGMAAGLFLAIHFAAWNASLELTSVANSVVLVNTIPLWVGLLTPLVTRERLSRATVISIVLSVTGGIAVGAADFHLSPRHLWGDFLAVIGAICAACYLVIGRNLRQRLSLLAYVTVCYAAAATVLWSIVAANGSRVVGYSWGTVGALLGLAVVSQIMGHTAYNWSLRWFSASFIAVTLLGEPIMASILAYLLFDEALSWSQAAGGALILVGIYIAASGERS